MAISYPTGPYQKGIDFELSDSIEFILRQTQTQMQLLWVEISYTSTPFLRKATEQALLMIANLTGAHQKSLQISYSAVQEPLKENIKCLTKLANDILTANCEALSDLTERMKDIYAPPSFEVGVPVIKEAQLKFLPSKIRFTKLEVIFSGNFAHVNNWGCSSKLLFEQVQYEPFSSSETELKFLVSIENHKLKPKTDYYSYLPGILSCVWRTHLLSWWTSFECNVWLGVPPNCVGTLTILYHNRVDHTSSAPIPVIEHTEEKKGPHWGESIQIWKPSKERIKEISLQAFDGVRYSIYPDTFPLNPYLILNECESFFEIQAKKDYERDGFHYSQFEWMEEPS